MKKLPLRFCFYMITLNEVLMMTHVDGALIFSYFYAVFFNTVVVKLNKFISEIFLKADHLQVRTRYKTLEILRLHPLPRNPGKACKPLQGTKRNHNDSKTKGWG